MHTKENPGTQNKEHLGMLDDLEKIIPSQNILDLIE